MRKTMITALLATIGGVPAVAAVHTVKLNANILNRSVSYDFGDHNAVIFSTVDRSFFAYNPDGVPTTGTVQVASLGAPFYDPPQPTSYFTDRGGSIGPTTLAQYVSYASPAAIPYSIVEGIVGFRFDLGQGYQYGYADLGGATLHGLRFETTPGTDVAIGAIPEPAAWTLMIAGFGAVGLAGRRRRAATA